MAKKRKKNSFLSRIKNKVFKPTKFWHFATMAIVVVGVGLLGVHWQNASHAASTIKTVRSVSYGSVASENLDVYHQAGAAKAPVVVVIHGGGWYMGDKSLDATESSQLADAGFVVFNIDYPLDTYSTAGYPMEVTDTESAILWVKAHAAAYGGDSRYMGLMGGSAGGHLADMAGLQLNNSYPGMIKAVVSLSGPTDLPGWITFLQNLLKLAPGNTSVESEIGWVQNFLGCPSNINACPVATEKAASPIDNITSRCPAFDIYNSSNEIIPYGQASSFAAALQKAGCNAQLHEENGGLHAEMYWTIVQSNVIKYLQNHLSLLRAERIK